MDRSTNSVERRRALATAAGVAAILLWGTNIAVSRSLSEKLGPLTAGAAVFSTSALLSLLWLAVSPKQRSQLARLRPAYLWGCGTLFVLYVPCLFLGLGLSADRQQAIEVGIVNYLWPSLTLVLAVPLLGKRMRWLLCVGMAMALAGVILAVAGHGGFTAAQLSAHLRGNLAPYLCGLLCAVSWAFYNVLSRRWTMGTQGGAVHVFMVMAALALIAVRCLFPEESEPLRFGTVVEIAYAALLPTLGAYGLWEYAMREGHIVLVASLSFFIPVLSTIASGLYLNVHLGVAVWAACALVTAGALLCHVSITERKRSSHDA